MRAMLAAALAALLSAATGATAQTYPDRAITVIVPYAPGGNTDVIARIMLEGMTPHIGQRFVIDRKSDDLAGLNQHGHPPRLDRQRILAEQLATPAMQGGDVGIVVEGDLVELVGGGNQLGGHVMAGDDGLEQHPQQVGDGDGRWRQRLVVRKRRQLFRRPLQPFLHRGQQAARPSRTTSGSART